MISTISTRFNQLHTAMIRMLSRLCVVDAFSDVVFSFVRHVHRRPDDCAALRAIISKVRWDRDDAAVTAAGDDEDIVEKDDDARAG